MRLELEHVLLISMLVVQVIGLVILICLVKRSIACHKRLLGILVSEGWRLERQGEAED